MNKFAIPAMLVATVLVAGAFSFAPVEKASTVHTSAALQSNVGDTGIITNGPFAFSSFHDSAPTSSPLNLTSIADYTIPGQASSLHIAVQTATDESDGDCNGGEDDIANTEIYVGNADTGNLAQVSGSMSIPSDGLPRGTNGSGNDICTFHGTFTTSSGVISSANVASITDVAINSNASADTGISSSESIVVTAKVKP